MALIKVVSSGEPRTEALRLAEAFRARAVDSTTGSFVFELTGASEKIETFIDLMRPLGLVEVSRTGIAAIAPRAEDHLIPPPPTERATMRVYYDRDADVNLIRGRKVAIVGYGRPGATPTPTT